MNNILEVADTAEIIVNGYAYTTFGVNVRVLNLNKPYKATVFSKIRYVGIIFILKSHFIHTLVMAAWCYEASGLLFLVRYILT